jgi:hypothetical protein
MAGPVVAFLEALDRDAGLQHEIASTAAAGADPLATMAEVAARHGWRFTREELKAGLDARAPAAKRELSPQDLDQVSGGITAPSAPGGARVNAGIPPSLIPGCGQVSAAIAAPFIPGGAVVSAAIGGLATLKDTADGNSGGVGGCSDA